MSDEDVDVLLNTGATIVQLGRMFNLPARIIREKLEGVDPICRKNHQELYPVALAAQYLVTPLTDIDEFISKMTEHDLPPAVQKAFWDGLRSRQQFEESAGDLWPTTKVVENVGTLVKTVAFSLSVIRDSVDRETELTPRQRQIITRLIDGARESMYEKVVEKFSEAGSSSAGIIAADEKPEAAEEEL